MPKKASKSFKDIEKSKIAAETSGIRPGGLSIEPQPPVTDHGMNKNSNVKLPINQGAKQGAKQGARKGRFAKWRWKGLKRPKNLQGSVNRGSSWWPWKNWDEDDDEWDEREEDEASGDKIEKRVYGSEHKLREQGTSKKEILMRITQNLSAVCPPGLACLLPLDELLVNQKIEMFEAITGSETQNVFEVRNSHCKKLFEAREDASAKDRRCFGSKRKFEMELYGRNEQKAIELKRPYACSCCNYCCLQKMTIEAPPGIVIGIVRQKSGNFRKALVVECPPDISVAVVKCPNMCTCNCCFVDIPYSVEDNEGVKIGCIKRKFTISLKGMLTDADNFSLTFPMSLDVRLKACLLGAVFLVDMMFHEWSANKNKEAKDYNISGATNDSSVVSVCTLKKSETKMDLHVPS